MKETDLHWPRAWRIISTRFPAIHLFEELADPGDWEALAALEALTNPSVLGEIGDLRLLPKSQRVAGPGATYVMAPFTHPNPGRFSTPAWGAFYAGRALDTAIAETVHHQSRFCRDSHLGPLDLDVRVLSLTVQGRVHDLRGLRKRHPEWYDPDDYRPPQELARHLREAGSAGLAYDSVRHTGGECVAAFTPALVSHCRHARYLCYRWDGLRISDVFEKKALKS